MTAKKFILFWFVAFFLSYAALAVTGLIPEELKQFQSAAFDMFVEKTAAVQTPDLEPVGNMPQKDEVIVKEQILPDRLIIEKIGVDAPVNNPQSRDIKVLDEALLSGVVRYPGSGGLDDNSNMFLFGHSTNWSYVQNQSYKSLNRLGELQIGDIVKVRSSNLEYRYRVVSMSLADKDKALVELSADERMITISTCDSFGEKNDRFVVKARFLEVLEI